MHWATGVWDVPKFYLLRVYRQNCLYGVAGYVSSGQVGWYGVNFKRLAGWLIRELFLACGAIGLGLGAD